MTNTAAAPFPRGTIVRFRRDMVGLTFATDEAVMHLDTSRAWSDGGRWYVSLRQVRQDGSPTGPSRSAYVDQIERVA